MFFEGNKMRKIIIHINYLFLLAILLFVTSCEHEVLISEDPEEIVDDKVRIEIFTRADSYKLPVTKGCLLYTSDHFFHQVVCIDNRTFTALHLTFRKFYHAVREVYQTFSEFKAQFIQ